MPRNDVPGGECRRAPLVIQICATAPVSLMSDVYSWYPWFTGDWQSSGTARAMSLEERGLYRELLDQQWNLGSLPIDEAQLRRLAGASEKEWKRSWPAVREKFVRRGERWVNERMEQIRVEQMARAARRSAHASHAAHARFQKDARRQAPGSAPPRTADGEHETPATPALPIVRPDKR